MMGKMHTALELELMEKVFSLLRRYEKTQKRKTPE